MTAALRQVTESIAGRDAKRLCTEVMCRLYERSVKGVSYSEQQDAVSWSSLLLAHTDIGSQVHSDGKPRHLTADIWPLPSSWHDIHQRAHGADLSVATWQIPQVEAHQAHQPLHMLLSSTGSPLLQRLSGVNSARLDCCPLLNLNVAHFLKSHMLERGGTSDGAF